MKAPVTNASPHPHTGALPAAMPARTETLLMLCGAGAAVIYAGTVVLGGLLRPGYDHVSQPISELVAADAPNRPLLSALFLLYNALVCGFGVGLARQTLHTPPARPGKVTGVLGATVLVVVGGAGMLLELFFPQDAGGAQAPTTLTGTMHVVVAGIAAVGTMLALIGLGLWFRTQANLRGYATYSFLTAAIVLVSGGIGAAAASSGGFAFFGIVERITIGAFILWLGLMGWKLSTTAPFATGPRRSGWAARA